MKLFLLLLATGCVLFAQPQPQIVITGPNSAHPGDTITLNLSLMNMAGSNITAAQWTMPVGVTLSGQQPALTNQSVFCGAGIAYCAIAGAVPAPVNAAFPAGVVFNGLALADSTIQTFNFQVPANAPNGSQINVAVSSPFAVDVGGASVNITVVPASIAVIDTLDLNGDGVVNLTDAQIALTRWSQFGGQPSDFLTLIRLMLRLKK